MIKHNKSTHEKLLKKETLASNEVIELLASHDTLTKKLTCKYLTDRSGKDAELSLLTANLLLKDAVDANPTIRSSSLLALSCLPDIGEAAFSAVFKAMKDNSAQVRRVVAVCCVNLHNHSPTEFLGSGLVDCLYEGIRDEDPVVITNCLLSLEKILLSEGSLVINRKMAGHLVSKVDQYSESSLVYIFNLLLRYEPKSEEELFSILNSLDSCLNSSIASVLVSASNLFIKLIKNYPQLKEDLLHTIKVPICKILSQNSPEVNYLLIDHLLALNIKLGDYFGENFKFFLPRTKDPVYLKEKKLGILSKLCTDNSVEEIISEVKHYVSDFQCFKFAFISLGTLALKNERALISVLDIVVSGMRGPNDQVVSAALECLLFISLRKYISIDLIGEHYTTNLLNALSMSHLQENNPQLVLRCLQPPSQKISDASVRDILESLNKLSDSWNNDTHSIYISTIAILFLHRPISFQLVLSESLMKAFKSTNLDIKQHAAYIYATLEEGPNEAKKLLCIFS